MLKCCDVVNVNLCKWIGMVLLVMFISFFLGTTFFKIFFSLYINIINSSVFVLFILCFSF